MDAIIFRGLERLLIIVSAAFIAWLGYKLYRHGITEGSAKLKNESSFMKLTLSGTGPGLFFMAFGALILMAALFTGGASMEQVRKEKDTTEKKQTDEVTDYSSKQELNL